MEAGGRADKLWLTSNFVSVQQTGPGSHAPSPAPSPAAASACDRPASNTTGQQQQTATANNSYSQQLQSEAATTAAATTAHSSIGHQIQSESATAITTSSSRQQLETVSMSVTRLSSFSSGAARAGPGGGVEEELQNCDISIVPRGPAASSTYLYTKITKISNSNQVDERKSTQEISSFYDISQSSIV